MGWQDSLLKLFGVDELAEKIATSKRKWRVRLLFLVLSIALGVLWLVLKPEPSKPEAFLYGPVTVNGPAMLGGDHPVQNNTIISQKRRIVDQASLNELSQSLGTVSPEDYVVTFVEGSTESRDLAQSLAGAFVRARWSGKVMRRLAEPFVGVEVCGPSKTPGTHVVNAWLAKAGLRTAGEPICHPSSLEIHVGSAE
jgi:hypothetical protein